MGLGGASIFRINYRMNQIDKEVNINQNCNCKNIRMEKRKIQDQKWTTKISNPIA